MPGFAMQGVAMEQLRILGFTILFGKHYTWVRLPDGRVALAPDPLCRERVHAPAQ